VTRRACAGLIALVVLVAVIVLGGPRSRHGTTPARAESPAPSAAAPGVRLVPAGRFEAPTFLTAPRGDRRRRFVTEREGRIRIVRDGHTLGRAFLDIADRVQTGGESGLLSMAFAPDYARSRRYFVYYVDNAGALVVDQFRASARNPDRTQTGSRRAVIREPHPRGNHKGGQIQFGRDGMLYIGFGDGGGSGDPDENAQDRSKLLGKLLRIDPRPEGGYRVPPDNPFAGRASMRAEIFAYGLRNPYRFSFDRRTGALTVGDVGEAEAEEIDFVARARNRRRPRAGVNFGWDVFEGRRGYEAGSAPGHLPPVIQRLHSQGSCSITGGYVIRDPALGRLRGSYVYGDLCDPRLRIARLGPRRARGDRALGPRVAQVVSFGEDGRGRVYVVSLAGPIFRLAPR